jgi:hypothetical protein
MFLDHFHALMSKIIFLKYKNIILIHFQVKNTLKNNRNHTSKDYCNILVYMSYIQSVSYT